MIRSASLVLLAALASPAPHAPAAEAPAPAATSAAKHLLRYKFGMGEVLRYQVHQSTHLRTSMEGATQRNASQTDSVKVWKVTDVLPTGNLEFIHLVESVKMSNEGSSQPRREFDSAAKVPPAPGFEAAARAVGVPLVVVQITPTGKVVSREQKLPKQAAPTEDMPITLELPEEPLAVGEKWSRSYDVAVTKPGGAAFKIRTRRVATLLGVKGNVATIAVEYQILTPVDAAVRAQIIERLTKGTVRFDIARGRVIQQSHGVDRREVGFTPNSQASSMHFVARTSEKLLPAATTVASVPSAVQPASASE
ncbi:MAG TPA: hypothetical protein VEQ85_09100 [Lacipirellulaceae bacterium]|nr:hypothetical protein [Lacipirellulaceae bacterium]